MKTRTCVLVTFGAHSCRLAQWQNVSTRSWCCRAAAPSGRIRRVSIKASPKPALLPTGSPGYRSARSIESAYGFRSSRPSHVDRRHGYCAISLYAFFTPVPEYYAPTLPVALYRWRYRFDERTNVDLLHSWSLLRLLFVFLLACPFLIIPVLLGLFKKQPGAEDRTEASAEGGTRVEVSGRGTWNAQADGRSQSSKPDGALAPIERRAA